MGVAKATIMLPDVRSFDDFRLIAFNAKEIEYVKNLLAMVEVFEADADALATRDAILRKIRTGSSVLVRDIQVEYPRYEGLV